jgi:hypothetical protein
LAAAIAVVAIARITVAHGARITWRWVAIPAAVAIACSVAVAVAGIGRRAVAVTACVPIAAGPVAVTVSTAIAVAIAKINWRSGVRRRLAALRWKGEIGGAWRRRARIGRRPPSVPASQDDRAIFDMRSARGGRRLSRDEQLLDHRRACG